MTTLRLTGIRAAGRHGASPGERDEPQEFVVDLTVEVSSEGDELAGTADYRDIVSTARRTVEEGSFVLLETLTREVAEAVRALPAVGGVTAVVHKPGAAGRLDVEEVSAEVSVS